MIIKTMSRKGRIDRTIKYLFKDEAKLKNEGGKPIFIRKNIRSRKLENIINEFKANEELRIQKRFDRVQLYHTVISFHEKDTKHLNEKALRDFVNKYMKERGNNLYIATGHFDKGHTHLHICESGSQYMTGKANSMSKKLYRELKQNLQAFQQTKYPQLIHSLPKHGKRMNQKEVMIDKRQTQKQALLECLKLAEKQYKNMEGFLTQIRQSGHEPYYRGEKLAGIKYNGESKFRFSGLGYKEKIEELNQQFNDEKQQLDELESLRSGSASREHDANFKNRDIDENKRNRNELEIDDDDR